LYPVRPRLPAHAAWAMAGFWYFFLFSLQLMYELALAVAVLGGLLSLCRRRGEAWTPWWPGFALAVGFGLLAKGPVVLLHLGVPLLAARWWHPAARADGRGFAKKAGLAALAGIGLFALWLVPALTLGDPEYREALLVTQTAGRIKDSFDHAEPWWWYAPMLLVLMAPWWWQAWWWRQLPALWRDPSNRFAWAWLLGLVLCFSLISGKQPYYLLPDFAAFALLLAAAAGAGPGGAGAGRGDGLRAPVRRAHRYPVPAGDAGHGAAGGNRDRAGRAGHAALARAAGAGLRGAAGGGAGPCRGYPADPRAVRLHPHRAIAGRGAARRHAGRVPGRIPAAVPFRRPPARPAGGAG